MVRNLKPTETVRSWYTNIVRIAKRIKGLHKLKKMQSVDFTNSFNSPLRIYNPYWNVEQ